MEKISEDEIGELRERMEALGIRIVDISSYPATKAIRVASYMVTVIAGYVSGKACAICVNFSGEDITFTVFGQVKESAWRKNAYEYFRKLRRNSAGHEIYGQTFSINHYIGGKGASVREKIDRGIIFFKDFLGAYGRILEKNKFSQHVHVWFVPVDSDEFLSMVGSKTGFDLKVNDY